MSGYGKNKAPRQDDDAYFTPEPLAREICGRLARALPVQPRRVLEPSAGAGAFVTAARAAWRGAAITSVDYVAAHRAACERAGSRFFHADFLSLERPALAQADLVVGNPPYALAEEFVRHALKALHPGASVAFLLRLSFLASQDRLLGLYREWPLRWLFPIAGRPSFTPDGRTDASEYGLFVWTREWIDHAQILDPIVWKPAAVARLEQERQRAALAERAAVAAEADADQQAGEG